MATSAASAAHSTPHAASAQIPWTPRLKLQRLGPNDLPSHQDLAGNQTSPPPLEAFLQQVYQEVHGHFAIRSSDIGTSKDTVTACANTYSVVVHKTKCKDREGLLWYGRRSDHAEGKPVGFEDLRDVLMKNHEKHEAEYTPALYDVNVLVDWQNDLQGQKFSWDDGAVSEVEMRITQMHHKMPGVGLNDRVFSVLLVSFANGAASSPEAIDVQIPVNVFAFPASILSRSHSHANTASASAEKLTYRNDDADATLEQKSRNGKEVVEGIYVSWEKITKIDDAHVEWLMRTASDAGGVLPGWIQRLGVPGAIAKDVPLAVKFAAERKG